MSWVGVAVIGVLLGYLAALIFGMAVDLGSAMRRRARATEDDDEDGGPSLAGTVAMAGLFALWLAPGDAIAAHLGGYPAATGALVGAVAGAAGGLLTAGLVQRLWAMGPVLWLGPSAVANAAACWWAFGS